MNVFNIIKAALVKGQLSVMLNKVYLRFFDEKSHLSKNDNLKWLSNNVANMSAFCMSINAELWGDVQPDVKRVCDSAKKCLEKIPHDFGGGGAYPLLYFIVRLCNPKVVVETGVASGFSTYAILDAMDKNKIGHLYSSDFPYFRLPEPEKFIGVVVPEALKTRWSLFVKGDNVNLPEINNKISSIDVFHYDSDKSYSGRASALKMLDGKITNKTWIIFDDIQDNSFFYDLVTNNNYSEWKVFEFEGKWVGIICSE